VVEEAAEALKQMMAEDDGTHPSVGVGHVTALGNLYSRVGALAHECPHSVEPAFGPTSLRKLMTQLHVQCSTQAMTVFEFFIEEQSIPSLMEQIGSATPPEPLMLDSLLQSIVQMCSYTSRYLSFMKGIEQNLDTTQLTTNMKMLLGYYLPLEEHYMYGVIATSMQQREQEDDDVQNSGMVDEVFFVLRKTCRRALSALDMASACAVINAARSCLDHPYMSSIVSILAECGRGASVFEPTILAKFFRALNELAIDLECVGKLQEDLVAETVRIFGNKADSDRIKACLQDLSGFAAALDKLRVDHIERYATLLLRPLESLFQPLATISYEMDEIGYERAEINDPFMNHLVDELSSVFTTLQPKLHPRNMAQLVRVIAQHFATRMESVVFSKRFSALGALQFSKEIRLISDYYVSVGGQVQRHCFSKLAQIGQILNLDRPLDVLDYWSEGKKVLKLTADDVKAILARRVDFSLDSIATLKLS